MVEFDPNISCNGCGACCSDMRLELTPVEAERMMSASSGVGKFLSMFIISGHDCRVQALVQLIQIEQDQGDYDAAEVFGKAKADIEKIKEGYDLYGVEGACGFLVDGKCTDYDNRPGVCRGFEMGGSECQVFRERSGIPVPVSIIPKPVL